jgi:hypothetical protein
MSDRDINAELEEARLLAAKAGEHHTPQFDGTTIVEENDSKWIAAELRALRLTIEYQARVQNRALTAIANHLSDLTRLPIKVEADRGETDHAE